MIAASDSRSASVTRSIEFDLRLMVIRLRRLRWIRPAARAARRATCSISFVTVKESITREEKRPAKGADQSTRRPGSGYLPAGVVTGLSDAAGRGCDIINRCAYGMIVVNRST